MTKLDDDSFLQQNKLPKGSMQLVDADASSKVLKETEGLSKTQSSGGSTANTIHGLAYLGTPCGYIGKIGDDELGKFFQNDMQQNNVNTTLFKSATKTGTAIALISPDSERTFATHLGAAVELSANDLSAENFKGYDYLHLEGYLVFNEELILSAAKLAKQEGLKIALDLASFNVVEAKLDFLKMLVREYIDIVFANEEEAKAFTGKEPEAALEEISTMSEIAVVKIGSKGSLIKHQGKKYEVGIIDVKPVDTTGAGDLYASGFLYGLTKNLSLDKCGQIGAILSGNVIEIIGSKMTDETWKEIREKINNI